MLTRPGRARGPLAATLLAASLSVVATLLVASPAAALTGSVEVRTLSNRADLLADGDVLVEVVVPADGDPASVVVAVDGVDVTDAFAVRDGGRVLGLVTGLAVGRHTLAAIIADGRGATLDVTMHPPGGPIIAGEQVEPWPCATEENGLGAPEDDDCNVETVTDLLYLSNGSGGLEPYDPAAPPADDDVASTTTDEGATVRFIVRRERGVLDRGIYEVAVLYDPDQPWEPWAPQSGWNGKLHWPFGGSCQPYHGQIPPGARPDVGGAPGVLDDLDILGRGFAVASSGFSVLGNNCNTIVAAEALMMVKERFVETYGEIRYTFGLGGSGGSLQQLHIAGAYPGLLDGLIPNATFPDILTTANENLDCRLMTRYFTTATMVWTADQQGAVMGQGAPGTCNAWVGVYGFPAMLADPTIGCTTPLLTYQENEVWGVQGISPEASWAYDPVENPGGVRCTIWDYMPAVFGRDEQGWAPWTFDNVGVQYGLDALLAGTILPEQFVHLNEQIGSLTRDYEPRSGRVAIDAGTAAAAYRSGQVTGGEGLALVPIIDGSFNVPTGDIHTPFHSWSVRERLVAANGNAANQVIRQAGGGDPAFDVMDAWLSAMEADTQPGSLADRIVRNRPDGLEDSGSYIGTNPRIAAGAPLADDVLKCRLRPLTPDEYDGLAVPMTEDQLARLAAVFPDGVCDWTRPGVGQQPTVTWASHASGTPVALGTPPSSVPFGPGATPAVFDGVIDGDGRRLAATGGETALLAVGLLLGAVLLRRRSV